MGRTLSSSPLVMGIIEDIDTYLIQLSSSSCFRSHTSGVEDDCNELVESIKEKGLLHPILVRPKDRYYEVVSGNRRFIAIKKIGLKKVTCHIIEADDKEAYEISLIENIQRKNLNPIEEANAFKEYVFKFGWGGISDLAKRIGKSISYIDKKIRILELPPDILDLIHKQKISASIAEEILPIKEKDKQSEMVRLAYTAGLSSRQVRSLVNDEYTSQSIYDYDICSQEQVRSIYEIDAKSFRTFDKAIIAIKMAMNKLSYIIEDNEENWIMHEILMQHKNMLHSQIDLLIKQKKKL